MSAIWLTRFLELTKNPKCHTLHTSMRLKAAPNGRFLKVLDRNSVENVLPSADDKTSM